MMTQSAVSFAAAVLFVLCISIGNCFSQSGQNELSLAGTWELALDSQSTGPQQLTFDKSIQLPGTLGDAKFGKLVSLPSDMTGRQILQTGVLKTITYVGKAWYRKNITVPPWAKGKTAILTLERVMWKSTVHVDRKEVGSQNSLSTPHRHDLTGLLDPGQHEIMICIDNTQQFNFLGAGNGFGRPWNGILGDLAIRFFDQVYISKSSVYPDVPGKTVRIKLFGNLVPKAGEQIRFSLHEKSGSKDAAEAVMPISSSNEYTLSLRSDVTPWEEFSPALYVLESSLLRDGKPIQTHTEVFGFRRIEAHAKRLLVNGRPVFLRGTLGRMSTLLSEKTITAAAGFKEIFKTARSYGLNHMRFHSSCPPAAAFEAADEIGFYLQVECPIWNLTFGKDQSVVSYITEEGKRILKEYGNHPSFCLMSIGNEMEGDFKVMTDLISILKAADNRILYTTTSFTFQKHPDGYPQPVDDFFVTQWTDAGWVRGQFLFDNEYPRFDQDYANASAHLPVPLITHEVGQHTAYPNLRELEKYTGMFEPVYLNWIKGDVEKKGLLPIIDDYVKASGKLQTLLYKEEIERALKTPGIHGFQLLALCDAGGSPVGVIDNFWEPKAYVDGKEFRQFCSEVVPLAWFKKAVHSNAESMVVQAGVANYYQNLTSRKLIGELSDISGRVLQRRELVVQQIPKGTADKYGRFEFDLVKMPAPGQFRLSLRIEGTEYRNSWPIWVYPEKAAITDDQIVITASFDAAEKALHEGKKVLLSPPSDKVKGTPGKFVTVFWSPTHFSHWEKVSEAGTMGLLIDPQHPAFSAFPTEFHSDWQWWDLCKKSETLAYDGTDIQPLITVIDNYHRNRRLTNLFEVAVGKGKLIFSSIDLISSLDERTEARQLRHSLLQYMKSAQFDPKKSISMQSLRQNYEVIAGIWPYLPPRY